METAAKVMVVDDDPDMRETLQMILESAGYVDDYVEKPIESRLLLESVGKIINRNGNEPKVRS